MLFLQLAWPFKACLTLQLTHTHWYVSVEVHRRLQVQYAQFAIMTQHSFWQQEIAHVTYAISCDLHVAAIALISWGLTASFDRLLLSSSMSWKGTLICAIFLLLSLPARAVDRGNFKTCDQSSFCRCALTRACFSTSGLAPRSARICPLLKSNSRQFAPIRTSVHQLALVYIFSLYSMIYKLLGEIKTRVCNYYFMHLLSLWSPLPESWLPPSLYSYSQPQNDGACPPCTPIT